MANRRTVQSQNNLSSARQRRQQFRLSQSKRTHQRLHDASDLLRDTNVDASGFAKMWIGVGLQIAAEMLDELAAEVLVEDIIEEAE